LHDVEVTSIKDQFLKTHVVQAERLRLMLTRLGPAFVKIGQVKSWNILECQHYAIEIAQIAVASFSLPYCILLAAGYQDCKLLACIHVVALIDACLQSHAHIPPLKALELCLQVAHESVAFQAGFFACTTGNKLVTMH